MTSSASKQILWEADASNKLATFSGRCVASPRSRYLGSYPEDATGWDNPKDGLLWFRARLPRWLIEPETDRLAWPNHQEKTNGNHYPARLRLHDGTKNRRGDISIPMLAALARHNYIALSKSCFQLPAYLIEWNRSKNKTPVIGYALPVLETKTKVVRILVIFQDRPMLSHIIWKVSARAFHWCCLLYTSPSPRD